MRCNSGQEGKFFYPEYFFLFVKPFKEGALSQRFPVGLCVSLLNGYALVCYKDVVTDFARLGKMKNARFCKNFERFCKIYFVRRGYFCP